MKLAQKIATGYIRAKLNMLAVLSPAKAAGKALILFGTPQYRSRKNAPEIFALSERQSFRMNGKRISGFRFNHPQDKKLLILHGFESSVYNFDHFISRGIKQGFEVLAFDAPAHGQSEGKTITLPEYVQMIREIVKRFGPVDAFIGHSFGGLAIAHYLETVPHDARTKAVLIAPATETLTAIDSFFRFLQLNESVRKEFDKLIIQKSGQEPSYFSVRRAMEHINASILWVHDEEDPITPIKDVYKVKAKHYPNVRFYFTRGLGHRRIYRDAEVKNEIFSFL